MKSLLYATSGLSTTKGSAIVPAAGMGGNATPSRWDTARNDGTDPDPGTPPAAERAPLTQARPRVSQEP